MPLRVPNSPRRPPTSSLSEWWKIVAMGVLLAALVYLAFVYEPAATDDLGRGPPIVEAEVATPELDQKLLRKARDRTREERMILEAGPLAHLLEKSLMVVPTVARALGMPELPIPVAHLRNDPNTYRGAYLFYTGELKYLSPGKSGHPVEGYKIYEGWIETDDAEKVLFRVSVPPNNVQVGDWVRVEGFFLKLRDSHHLPQAEMAPLLVGPEIFPDYAAWPPVEDLDPQILADIREDAVHTGFTEKGREIELRGLTDDITGAQGVPLWHLASYAVHHRDRLSRENWLDVPALMTEEQFATIRDGTFPRGAPMRVMGTFQEAFTLAAKPNPVGIDHWTEAWVQIRLEGKLIPIWIPDRIDPDMKRYENLEVRGYYYGRRIYATEVPVDLGKGRTRIVQGKAMAPVFVAASLDRFVRPAAHPMTSVIKWIFVSFVAFVVALFFWIHHRDQKQRERHEREMIERRRKRRSGGDGAEVAKHPA